MEPLLDALWVTAVILAALFLWHWSDPSAAHATLLGHQHAFVHRG